MTTDIEVVYEGSDRERALRSHGPDSKFFSATFIRVGRFHDDHVRVVAYVNGRQMYFRDVIGTAQWEPETRNKIGSLGAFRNLPPDDREIQQAIERARAAILRDSLEAK